MQKKTTQLFSRNETTQLNRRKQLNSATGTKQLNSAAGTKQLNSSVGTKQLNSALPSTAYNRLQPPKTACNHLQPPATACTAFTAESAFSTYLRLRKSSTNLTKWYWARTRDKASHVPIPIPLGYRRRTILKDTKEARGGRVRSTTPAEDRYIVLSAKRNRRTTAQQVANQFLAALGKQISRKPVARRLRGGGLYTRRPVVCVPLTRQHRTARFQWCREHHNWTEQDWACVLFSNESRFSLSSNCRRQLIWRESGTAYRPENIQEKDRYPTCSIMVWPAS
ncbi:transposable element Tcb2 transposase [Trichonephila clavipes]|nr:transposable element Tcb2 transposase [Trichonephila clavipes]